MSRDAEQSSATVRQAAWEWVVRHDRGLTAAEGRAFASWRDTEPAHAAEFGRAVAAWQRLNRLRQSPRLQAAADQVLHRVRERRRFKLAGGLLLAAAAMVMFGFLGWRWEQPKLEAASNYQVLASTAHVVRLPDGSTVLLNGDSRIETNFTATERRVWLRQGEALFTVTKNAARPFFVTAGPVTVRAVGTAFNVEINPSAINVLVTEGRVRVNDSAQGNSLLPPAVDGAEPLLQAGQQARVELASGPSAAVVMPVAPYEVEQALAWQATRLVFRDTPLDEVVSAFNHYNPRKLALAAPELRARKITGIFRADNVDGFLRLLVVAADVKTDPRGPTETLLSPSP